MKKQKINKKGMTKMPTSKYVNDKGEIRPDIRAFLFNLVFKTNLNKKQAFDMTYINLEVSEYRESRLYWQIMKEPVIKVFYDKLIAAKENQDTTQIEIREVLTKLKEEKKYKEYTDLLKVYKEYIKNNQAPIQNTINKKIESEDFNINDLDI